ncbi:glycosyltransferase family 4 protein [Brachyspira pilosicoli]
MFLSTFLELPDFIKEIKHIDRYTILHDIIPVLFPQYYPSYTKDSWHSKLMRYVSNTDDYFFSVSNSTKNDVIKHISNVKPNNISVIHIACDDNFSNFIPVKDKKEIFNKYNIPLNKKYVFTLCTREPRKNLIRIIKTFNDFLEKNNINDIILILGGSAWEHYLEEFNTKIEAYKSKILITGYIDDEDLPYIYKYSQWFIYTSEYEGFGLPPLEAMSLGCPVITSNNSSLPEVVGDAGIMIDWNSDEQHIEAYEKYYFDEEYRKEMSKKALEHSKIFSWEKSVDKMIDIMKSRLKKHNFKYFFNDYFLFIKFFNLKLILPILFHIRNNNNYKIINIFGIKITLKK